MTESNTLIDERPGILIVEDERDLADLYVQWLGETYRTEAVYSGANALEAIDETIDIVFLDRRMPEIDGDEVLTEIRTRELDTRVVMTTAVTPDFDIIDMGFDEYLTKPITKEDLLDTINRLQRRGSYTHQLDELYTLVSKRAALETEKRSDELESSKEYTNLQADIASLTEHLQGRVSEIDDAEFRVLMDAPYQTEGIQD